MVKWPSMSVTVPLVEPTWTTPALMTGPKASTTVPLRVTRCCACSEVQSSKADSATAISLLNAEGIIGFIMFGLVCVLRFYFCKVPNKYARGLVYACKMFRNGAKATLDFVQMCWILCKSSF